MQVEKAKMCIFSEKRQIFELTSKTSRQNFCLEYLKFLRKIGNVFEKSEILSTTPLTSNQIYAAEWLHYIWGILCIKTQPFPV